MKKNKAISRRRFLISGGKAAIVAGGAVATSTLIASDSYAADQNHIDKTLLRMGRDIYPHDKLDNKYYTTPLNTIKKDNKKLFYQGVKDLDALSIERIGKNFVDITNEVDRVRLLRSIEETPFFSKVKVTLLLGIYNNPEVWPMFGYEGSSWEKGGYINRGFNDIDWLETH